MISESLGAAIHYCLCGMLAPPVYDYGSRYPERSVKAVPFSGIVVIAYMYSRPRGS